LYCKITIAIVIHT